MNVRTPRYRPHRGSHVSRPQNCLIPGLGKRHYKFSIRSQVAAFDSKPTYSGCATSAICNFPTTGLNYAPNMPQATFYKNKRSEDRRRRRVNTCVLRRWSRPPTGGSTRVSDERRPCLAALHTSAGAFAYKRRRIPVSTATNAASSYGPRRRGSLRTSVYRRTRRPSVACGALRSLRRTTTTRSICSPADKPPAGSPAGPCRCHPGSDSGWST